MVTAYRAFSSLFPTKERSITDPPAGHTIPLTRLVLKGGEIVAAENFFKLPHAQLPELFLTQLSLCHTYSPVYMVTRFLSCLYLAMWAGAAGWKGPALTSFLTWLLARALQGNTLHLPWPR